MASLSKPYLFDVNDVFAAENAGYAKGKLQRQDQTNAFAGQRLAQGDYKGAKNAFYEAGDIEGGFKIQSRIDAMDDRQRAATKRITEVVGNAAMAADNPEAWARVISGLEARGLDVKRFRDFSMRDAALAEAGMTIAHIERLDKLKQQGVDNSARERSLGLQERGVGLNERQFDYTKQNTDRTADLNERQFAQTKANAERTADLNEDQFDYTAEKDAADRAAAVAKAQAEAAKPDMMEVNKRVFDKKAQRYIPRPADEAAEPDGALPEELRKALATKDAATAMEYGEGSQKAGDIQSSLNAIRAQRAKTNWEGPNLGIKRGIGRVVGGIPFVSTPSDDLAAMDAMDAEASKMVQSAAGALKGTLSDRDLELLQRSVPGSEMTDEAAEPIIAGIEAGTARAQARAEFFDEWLRVNRSGRGFSEAWNRFINDKPILTEDKSGKLIVNRANATAWQPYLGRPGTQRTPTGRTQYQPLPQGGFAGTKKTAPPSNDPFMRPAPQQRRPEINAKEMTTEELQEYLGFGKGQ